MLLDAARRSVLVEDAFGDAWKHFDHGIGTILLVHVRETEHICAVGQECAAQKFVHENDVGNDIDKVQNFAEEIAERVAVVCAHTGNDIIDETTLV